MSGNEILTVVVAAALKGSAILVLALIVTLLWRSASAASKHLIWTLSVALCVAMPLIAAALDWIHAPEIPVTTWKPVVDVNVPEMATSIPSVTQQSASNEKPSVADAPAPPQAIRQSAIQTEPAVEVSDEPSPIISIEGPTPAPASAPWRP